MLSGPRSDATIVSLDVLQDLVEALCEPVAILDRGAGVRLANQAFARRLGPAGPEARPAWMTDELRRRIEDAAASGAGFEDFTLRREPGAPDLIVNARPIRPAGDALVVLTIGDLPDSSGPGASGAEPLGSGQKLVEILDALPGRIAVLDDGGAVLLANSAWVRHAEESRNGAAPATDRGTLPACGPGESGERGALGLRDVLAGRRRDYTQEYSCGSPSGERWFVMQAARLTHPGPARVVVLHEEITDRVRAEEASRRGEQRLRFLARLEEETRSLAEPERIMEASTRLLGTHLGATRCAYADVEADEDTFTIRGDYTRPGCPSSAGNYRLDDFGRHAAGLMRRGETLVIRDLPGELDDDDGGATFRAIGIRAIICCPLLKRGKLTAMMALHQDQPRDWDEEEVALLGAVVERCWAYIERAKSDRLLRESELRFRQLADSMPQSVWSARADGVLDYYNERWYAITGATRGKFGDESWVPYFHPDDVPPTAKAWKRSITTGIPFEIQHRIWEQFSGEYRWYLSRALPIRDDRGEIIRWFGTNTDIDHQKRAEAATLEARNEAEAANRMKDDFLATLGHELRTPLNAVLGWAKLLRSGELDREDADEGLAAIERNAMAQAQIIEDLLDISRIISGKFRLEVGPTDLREVIEAAMAAVGPAAAAKQICLESQLDETIGPIAGDPSRLQQVAWNLLSNALKFTPGGGVVRIRLERIGSSVELSVTDSGLGIDARFLPYVFDRFRQQDSSTTRRHTGLGLGLAIVKQLVELHGGTISASSPGPGLGSTFRVRLPVAAVGRNPPPEAAPAAEPRGPGREFAGDRSLAGLRVLVVDDEPDTRDIIRRILIQCGARVELASSAAEGLELVARSRPDVIVSDIGMPDQDGYDFIRQVRAKHPSKELPAVALTAFARSEDRRQALLAGFQTHLPKPVDPSELVAVIASLAGRTGVS